MCTLPRGNFLWRHGHLQDAVRVPGYSGGYLSLAVVLGQQHERHADPHDHADTHRQPVHPFSSDPPERGVKRLTVVLLYPTCPPS
jgi:hypothetical protein